MKRPRESLTRFCRIQAACDGNRVQGEGDVCHRCQEKLKKRAVAESKGLRGEKWVLADEHRNATRARVRPRT